MLQLRNTCAICGYTYIVTNTNNNSIILCPRCNVVLPIDNVGYNTDSTAPIK